MILLYHLGNRQQEDIIRSIKIYIIITIQEENKKLVMMNGVLITTNLVITGKTAISPIIKDYKLSNPKSFQTFWDF